MPSRAALAFSLRCSSSGTFLSWIIRDMLKTYLHVPHMSTLGERAANEGGVGPPRSHPWHGASPWGIVGVTGCQLMRGAPGAGGRGGEGGVGRSMVLVL